MQDSFWRNVLYALKLIGPLVEVLRLVDGEKYPAMGYIYDVVDMAKEAIRDSFSNADDYKTTFQIIDQSMRLVPDQEVQDKISAELDKYRNAEGLFGHPMAIKHRKTKAPADWWASYGSSAPNLKKFVIRVLIVLQVVRETGVFFNTFIRRDEIDCTV
ncbi:unnamed protein product [Lactuca saligna]|uniref:HAT C-terminal dimerisation domain-containing protein n=1 Tax=Lactuca saligna TaxID=75948 RepID=A0AA35VHX2_LACSI|nr:unnamed protein product [Lactuca saligna]